jgi:microcystin-dependent protein
MSEPFIAEVKIISWNFAPKGWAFCNGQFLAIAQNQALFSILGTTYGGNGTTTFALPDLRGRTPVHVGNGIVLGQKSGEEAHTLTNNEMTAHNHFLTASSAAANAAVGLTGVPGTAAFALFDTNPSNLVPTVAGTVTNTGGSQPHNNVQPYLVLNFVIALSGIFPSRN